MYVTLYVIDFFYYSANIPMSPLHDSNVTAKGKSIHIHNLYYCHIVFTTSFTLGATTMSFSLDAIINLSLWVRSFKPLSVLSTVSHSP